MQRRTSGPGHVTCLLRIKNTGSVQQLVYVAFFTID